MKAKTLTLSALVLAAATAVACSGRAGAKLPSELKGSFRRDASGWIYVHLAGSPREVGFQHGYHPAPEIDEALRMFAFFLEKATGRDWATPGRGNFSGT